jgi:hypothetical protein
MEEYMKKIMLILFAVIAVVAMQSCDTPFSEKTDLTATQEKGLTASLVIAPAAYRLVEGSTLYYSVSPDGPEYAIPINGSFSLNPALSQDTKCGYYSVADLAFESKDHNPRYAGKAGSGKYELCVSGTVAPRQRMNISVSIAGSRLITMDSGYVQTPSDIRFPWIDVTMKTVSVSADVFVPSYSLRIVAVPMKDIAFTTTNSFTSGNTRVRVTDGDLLSVAGKIILTNGELIKNFNLWPTFVIQEPGLDAVDIPLVSISGSVRPFVYFSTNKDILADGNPGQGDILDNTGKIVMRNKELVAAFGPMPIAPNAGLDALALYPYNSTTDKPVFLFSFVQGFFSETLGVYISAGDILLSVGKVFMTEAEILRNFKPIDMSARAIGVDAFAIRSNGEVWFSVSRDFADARLGKVGNGDLLSDNGRVVYRNLDLVAGFQPMEKLADFGLDGLSITE